MADLANIKKRLDALLKRARDGGSSDAEIATCMQKAEKLMQEYGLSEADLDEVTADSMRDYQYTVQPGRSAICPVVRYCGAMVAKFTGTIAFVSGNGQPNARPITFYGLSADVEYATWLLASLRQFMDDQWIDYRDSQLMCCTREELKAERIGFIRGFTSRITQRMAEMMWRNERDSGLATGTDLIVKKNEIVQREFQRKHGKLGGRASVNGTGRGAGTGAQAGAQAGNAASIGRGVGGSGRIAIGSR